MIKIILASQSPRRRELLTQMGVEYEVVPSGYDEKLDDSRSPEEVSIELALGKAMAVAEEYPDAIVIGSDLIVTVDGKQLGKPHDLEEAHEMLKLLSGRSNDVSTAVAVVRIADGTKLLGVDTTKVYFRPYAETAITKYIETGDSLDKAGGYAIQSGAAPLIDHIEGHYDTIIGMPTHLLAKLLEQVGIKSHAVNLEPPVPQVLN